MTDPRWNKLDTLILVAGHAIYVASDFSNPSRDDSWLLQPFQKGEPPSFIQHIEAGVSLAAMDQSSLLVFSGGQTRVDAGARSEAGSYWLIGEHVVNWDDSVRFRSTTEDYARDSFENLLFGICRFFECTARYPRVVKVVSWRFKEARFDLHRIALRLPRCRYSFVGVNNPAPDKLVRAEEGEHTAAAQFADDPYGVRVAPPDSPSDERRKYLGEKRRDRNPFNRQAPYPITCPSLCKLLTYRATSFFNGELPW